MNGLFCWVTAGFVERLGSWKYWKLGTGTFACIWDKVFFICVILDITLSRVSCKVSVADKGSWAIFVISVYCWFNVILETGTVYIVGLAVFWTWTWSVIVGKGVLTRLLLSVLTLGTHDVISGNFRLIPLVLVCSTEFISKQIHKNSY